MNKHHEELKADMESLGVFWGTMRSMRSMLKDKADVTVREVLGEGKVWKCEM
jgi:hypothetical protein